ncbi:MAG: hypothetical protein EHM70_15675 [Chloroflexota bacterium]|nr:MAG: hypothetical protein EHM70_15675 [Chloroflexota bacterium]
MISALMAGLAAVTRYAGVTLVAAAAVYLLLRWFRGRSSGARPASRSGIYLAVLYGVVGSLPFLAYAGRNWLATGHPFGPRTSGWEAFTQDKLTAALFNILTWFIPGRFVKEREIVLALGLLAVLAAGSAWLAFSRSEKIRQVRANLWAAPLFSVTLLLVGFNFALLFASRMVFGKGDAFNERYLAPIYLAVLFIVVTVLARFWETKSWLLRAGVGALAAVLLLTYAYRTLDTVRYLSENGAGYASARWHISETVAYLNNHPDVPVVATGEVGIYFWTDRLPRSVASFENIDALHAFLEQTGAFLVIIDSMPPEMYGLDEPALVEGLELVHDFSEGSVYQAPR